MRARRTATRRDSRNGGVGEHQGVDIALDCSGMPALYRAVSKLIRPRGQYTQGGICGREIGFPVDLSFYKLRLNDLVSTELSMAERLTGRQHGAQRPKHLMLYGTVVLDPQPRSDSGIFNPNVIVCGSVARAFSTYRRGASGAYTIVIGGLGTGELNAGGSPRFGGSILTVDGVLYTSGHNNAWVVDAPGFLQSFDPKTGNRQWVTCTVPMNKGDEGLETWASLDTARHGGVQACPRSLRDRCKSVCSRRA